MIFYDFFVDFLTNILYNITINQMKTQRSLIGVKMYRKIIEYLEAWKRSPHRKPLILQGARQVGKTYSILEFGHKNYDNVAYFNFEINPKLNETFEENISPDYLVPLLSKIANTTITKEKTLIVFDEVQLSERALSSLKYFYENANEYHIIVAGSLLGIAVHRAKFSFPVGKVDIKTLYPMDMEEFLMAMNERELLEQIKVCFDKNEPLPKSLHEYAIDIYKKYLIIGGMPECVLKFVETGDYVLVKSIQENILYGYLNDMSKYNLANETKKTRLTYDNVAVQLSKKNTRFQYKLLKKGARASEFENAIEWLILTGIINKVYKVSQIKKPLDNYKDIDAFKIYLSDVGLLCAKKNLVAQDIFYDDELLHDFRGGLVENYVFTQLLINGFTPYYWDSNGCAEVDFIVNYKNEIIPIEVKAADNTKSKSLNVYMNLYKPPYAFKISMKNFAMVDNKKIIPLYACFCIKSGNL